MLVSDTKDIYSLSLVVREVCEVWVESQKMEATMLETGERTEGQSMLFDFSFHWETTVL